MTAELLLQMVVGTTVVVVVGALTSRIGRRASGAFGDSCGVGLRPMILAWIIA